MKHSSEFFDKGLAIAIYDIAHDHETYRFRDETFQIATGSVPTSLRDLTPNSCIRVAKIEDVRRAAAPKNGSQWPSYDAPVFAPWIEEMQ